MPTAVRVSREDGEATRERLADADLVDRTHRITVDDGWLYVPVTDPAAVPDDLDVVEVDLPARDTRTDPADLLDFDPSYERLGDVVIVDEDDPDRAREVSEALMASDIRPRTVVNRASKVKGETRVRDWTVLAHDPARAPADFDPPTPTTVRYREYGNTFEFDIADVYFSPRLATERHRVVEQSSAGERAFDMFAGVGPYAVPLAGRGCDVVATDVNPDAVDALRANAARNGVAERITAVAGDVRAVVPDYRDWADRVVMNLPHSADEFLDAAVALADDDCVLHYYDIQHEDDPFGPGETAIREAAEPAGYEVRVETRREVRSYAPHELNVVLDVRLRRA